MLILSIFRKISAIGQYGSEVPSDLYSFLRVLVLARDLYFQTKPYSLVLCSQFVASVFTILIRTGSHPSSNIVKMYFWDENEFRDVGC